MSTASLSHTDRLVRDDVAAELGWDSAVDASAIGVAAKDGAVTLTGFIDSYAGKLAAERAAKRVRGVRAVANEIQVRLMLGRTDEDLAAGLSRALRDRTALPDSVQATVHSGHVTLTGQVGSLLQRAIAEFAASDVKGVKAVINRVEVVPRASSFDVHREIARALHRAADIDAGGINVTIDGPVVRLSGTVNSFQEREAAERAASHAANIAFVDNQLAVSTPKSRPHHHQD